MGANHLGFQYHGITVNTEVIDSLPENGVPQVILDRWTNSNDEDANAVESSGYVPEYPICGVQTETTSETQSCECSSCSSTSSSVSEDSDDNQSSPSTSSSSSTSKPPPDIDLTVLEPCPEVEIPLEPVAMMDVDSTEVHVQDSQRGAKENLRQSLQDVWDEPIRMTHTDKPTSFWDNAEYWTMGFPTLFPNGLGGFENMKGRVKMHLWVRHLLKLRDNRLRTHYSFMFVCYNILNTLSVFKAARFKVMSAVDAQSMSKIKKKDIQEMVDAMDLSEVEQKVSSQVESLLKHVSAVGRNVPGSDYWKKKKRIELRSMTLRHGFPTLFLKLNPNDLTSPLLLMYAGETIRLDDPFGISDFPKNERAKIVARDPVAGAKFFHKLSKIFLRTGIKKNGDHGIGILGRIKAFYGCSETQARGMLHFHMEIWIHGAPNG